MTSRSTRQFSLFAAWLIALVALLGTLYASEIRDIPVCPLCWYQRISIYPLTLILGIATYRNDIQIAVYAIPLAVIGAFFAAYQYAEQMIPGFAPIDFCRMGSTECSNIHFKLFGFITFPFLSLIGCLVIILLMLIAYCGKR